MIPRVAFIKCLTMWHKRIGPVSGRGCRFVLCALFTLYISHFLPHFSYFIIVDLHKESLSLQELRFRYLVNLVAFVLLLRPSPFKKPSTLLRIPPLLVDKMSREATSEQSSVCDGMGYDEVFQIVHEPEEGLS